MTNKAQWKYYRDNVVSTLKTIAKYVEQGKYDYEQQDLDDLLDRAKHDYAHYLELRDGEKEKTISKANAIEL
jgi:hypothetical protein|tara:strand:+ start:89 stop:304 length:216 start_codon:yes stop_codon:yes gene_type:complete